MLTLKVEDKPIVKADASGDNLKLEWVDKTWGEWKELTESASFLALVQKGDDALKARQETQTKGRGKGKTFRAH